MINKVNQENTIGIKKLTEADLGKSSGNQTHIGLFEGTLNFIELKHQIISSQFIFDNKVIELLSLLDPIENPDGSFRSPKIRAGKDSELNVNGVKINSVVRTIRDVAKDSSSNWFLLWFGLDTNELVFHLFSEGSDDYKNINNIVGLLGERNRIKNSSRKFVGLTNYLGKKVEDLNIEYYKELEYSSQINPEGNTRRVVPRARDIAKAKKMAEETGRKGEDLLNDYLERRKFNSLIKDFTWMNKSSEKGKPYDFEITNNHNSLIYSDAKATRYKFEQPFNVSSGELQFINQNKKNYQIHRLYSVFETPKLRVCENIYTVSDIFIPEYKKLTSSLDCNKLSVTGLSVTVPTSFQPLIFNEEISLDVP